MVRALCFVIMKVIGPTIRTRAASLELVVREPNACFYKICAHPYEKVVFASISITYKLCTAITLL